LIWDVIVRGHLSVSLPLLFSPTIPLNSPCSYVYSPHLCNASVPLQGPYPKPMTFIPEGPTTFCRSTHQMSSTFILLLRLYLSSTRQASDTLGQVHMTLWHPLPSCGYLFMGGLVLGGLVL
jgi:hypothetical protein